MLYKYCKKYNKLWLIPRLQKQKKLLRYLLKHPSLFSIYIEGCCPNIKINRENFSEVLINYFINKGGVECLLFILSIRIYNKLNISQLLKFSKLFNLSYKLFLELRLGELEGRNIYKWDKEILKEVRKIKESRIKIIYFEHCLKV